MNEYEDVHDWVPPSNDTPQHKAEDDSQDYCVIVSKPPPVLPRTSIKKVGPIPLPKTRRRSLMKSQSLTDEESPTSSSKVRTSSLSTPSTKHKPPIPTPLKADVKAISRPPPPAPPPAYIYTVPLEEITDDSSDVLQSVCKVTSKPYSLETFCKEFQFPQLVRVCTGHLGATEEHTMSEGEELVLFFVKTSQVVIASSERGSEFYHIPLNSSLQFAPHQYKSVDLTLHYKTVDDVLNSFKKDELPKVMRVCKSYKGKSDESSVQTGELIFPGKVSSKKFKTVLECLNNDRQVKRLELTCAGDFSINPGDVKMYLEDFVHFIKEVPISVKVFNDKIANKKSFCIDTGTVLTLKEPKPLQSYICTTDVFGKMDYPLMDLPMSMPIEVECIQHDNFDMSAIFSKTQRTYENFRPSLIQKSMFPSQSTSELIAQQQLYEEVLKDDGTLHIYSLEKPNIIYDQIPAHLTTSETDGIENERYSSLHPIAQPGPPLPPRDELVKYESPYHVSDPLPELPTMSTDSREDDCTLLTAASDVSNSTQSTPAQPSPSAANTINASPSVHSNMSDISTSSNLEDNISYLKSYTLADMLQLLENMNLGEYKKSFGEQQIDGEIFVCLEKSDLEDLGVTKSIHQKRLIKLIDGTVSAKKYEGGAYETLKTMQTLA
ncbi:uncharacterized protein [Dysidea avara]|uniref:uncharacterized protein n=1 Tax=Dysidea avara TaxID=196820 RepID=UPI00331AB729